MEVDPFYAAKTGVKVHVVGRDGGCLHVHGGKAYNGAPCTIWERCDSPNLFWRIVPATGGNGFHLQSEIDPRFVLHQNCGSQDDNGDISIWEKDNHSQNLVVDFQPTGDGAYYIKFRHSGKGVHVYGGGRNNDTRISQWTCVNQNNLKWTFWDPFASHQQQVTPQISLPVFGQGDIKVFFESGAQRVALRDWKGRYVHAHSNGTLSAQPTNTITNEHIFHLHHAHRFGQNHVQFQNLHTNQFICAENNHTAVCNRGAGNEWESFVAHFHDGAVSFKSWHGKWLCAEDNGVIVANRDAQGPWETFHVVRV